MYVANQLRDLETITDAAKFVFRMIAGVINLKKHTQGKPYSVSVSGNNNSVLVVNANGSELAIPIGALELFREKLIHSDLNKIASPLSEQGIEQAELIADEGTEMQLEANINSSEREYFRPDSATIQIREMELVGTLVSLNKETNRGTFKLTSGNIPYRYIGDHSDQFYSLFAHTGPCKVLARAEFDENGIIQRIDVISAHLLQADLGFSQT
jgi:hypothetical protein